MGVFIAQALIVLLGLAAVVLSLALLALLTDARRKAGIRAARIVLEPARRGFDHTDSTIRSVIDRGQAAPSRAPPTFSRRAHQAGPMPPVNDSADASAG
jgi:hypothetical protein